MFRKIVNVLIALAMFAFSVPAVFATAPMAGHDCCPEMQASNPDNKALPEKSEPCFGCFHAMDNCGCDSLGFHALIENSQSLAAPRLVGWISREPSQSRLWQANVEPDPPIFNN